RGGHVTGVQTCALPIFGSVVSKVLGATHPAIPAFVGLEPKMQHNPYNSASAGFLGISHRSFRPEGEAKGDMVLNGVTLDRLGDRSEERRVGKEGRGRGA